MFHIFGIVASALGVIGGILGVLAFFMVLRRRADHTIPSELPSRLQELARKKGLR
jgi:hypothetical protein